jgi:hypothetical protein
MSKVGLIITINKFTNYFESNCYTILTDSLYNAKNELVLTLVENFKHINIDFPNNLNDFEYIWFKQQYVKANAFLYKVFSDDKWSEPWDYDDIYTDVLNILEEHEISNAPDFSKIYAEPDPDEDVSDNFTIENNEQTHEFETKLKEIISQAQSVKLKEDKDEVKDCPCENCKEGYHRQQMKKEIEL